MTIQLMKDVPNKGFEIASKITHNRLHTLWYGILSSFSKVLYPKHHNVYTISILKFGLNTVSLSVIIRDYMKAGIEQGLLEDNDPDDFVAYQGVKGDRKN